MGTKNLFGMTKKSSKTGCGDVCTTLKIYQQSLNFIPKIGKFYRL